MPFKSFLPAEFAHEHERLLFDELRQLLDAELEGEVDHYALIGNLLIGDSEIDALFIQRNAITIIEFKEYGGEVHFSENGPWTAAGIEVRGNKSGNPFRQVRGYRFDLMNWFNRKEDRLMAGAGNNPWGHISGMVLFGKPITFNEQLPVKINPWFHICDINEAVDRLLSLESPAIHLSGDIIDRMIEELEVGAPIPRGQDRRFRVAYLNQSGFREVLIQMQEAGGPRQRAAMRIRELVERARGGADSFATVDSIPADGIEGGRIYNLFLPCKLVAIRHNNILYLCYAGLPDEVNRWLESHRGMTIALDAQTGQISLTTVSPGSDGPQELPASSSFTTDNKPFFSRVEGIDLENLVPQKAIRKLLNGLNENSTEDEVLEVLDAVADRDLRTFLFDIIYALRTNDIKAAEARIRLRNGEALPAMDAGSAEAEAIDSRVNSDQVVVLSDKLPGEIEQLLDPSRFEDWMLYLHPDQKDIVDQDFERPVILSGVSGSGKTCILVHRARRLAEKYPGERIGIITLNRSLARLIQNLVNKLCVKGENSSIHVMAFYDYFQSLIRTIGAHKYLQEIHDLFPAGHGLREVANYVDPRELANEEDYLSGENLRDTWEDYWAQDHIAKLQKRLCEFLQWEGVNPPKYLKDEFLLIRSAFSLRERKREYMEVERKGRAIRLDKDKRDDVLTMLHLYEEYMLHGHMMDDAGLSQILIPVANEVAKLPADKRFRCLLVDEFQDLSTLDFRILIRVPTDAENGLFLAGDRAQKIFTKSLSFEKCTLGQGNATQLSIKKNYRNSRQILDAASLLVSEYGNMAKAQGVEIELLDPELAARETAKPIARKAADPVAEAWRRAEEWRGDAEKPKSVCIAVANPDVMPVDEVLKARPAHIKAALLTGDYLSEPDTMVIGHIGDVKGFDFSLIVIVGLDSKQFPDKDQPKEECWRDALRLYVAMTRGRDQVVMLYENEPSEFLRVMSDKLLWETV